MKKFKITFVHTVEQTYEALVEAETEQEAKEKFGGNVFGNLINKDPIDEQGIDIDITDIIEEL